MYPGVESEMASEKGLRVTICIEKPPVSKELVKILTILNHNVVMIDSFLQR